MVIIKATRLQAWAPAGGGAKVGHRPPPSPRENFLGGYIGCLFATFSSYGGLFATFFSILVPFGYFLFHGVGLFWACTPPPLRKFLRAPMIARRVREHAPPKFFCVTAI